MVANWQMLVVWLQGVIWASEYDTAVVGMVQAREEVGVVTNLEWNMAPDCIAWQQSLFLESRIVLQDIWVSGIFGEHTLNVLANNRVNGAAECSECIQ